MCGKAKHCSTVVQQKDPVTNVKRLCHVDYLLHSRVTSIASKLNVDDVATRVIINTSPRGL